MRKHFLSLLVVLFVGICCAQNFDLDSVPHFVYSDEVTASGVPVKWTLQTLAKAERSTYVIGLSVYCEVACEAEQILNGTTATATAVTAIPLNLAHTPVAAFFKNSNSTGGSLIKPIKIPAGATVPLASSIVLRRNFDTVQNYSISVTAASGAIRVYEVTAEKR